MFYINKMLRDKKYRGRKITFLINRYPQIKRILAFRCVHILVLCIVLCLGYSLAIFMGEYWENLENNRILSNVQAWNRKDAERETWIKRVMTREKNMDEASKTLVTFVIPSRGRPSLTMALVSLLNQEDPRWKAIVVLNHNGILATKMRDDVFSSSTKDATLPISKQDLSTVLYNNIVLQDSRISFRIMAKSGRAHGNEAGEMRNAAFEFVNPKISPWTAFLDDDDVLTANYVSSLSYETTQHPEMDAIIFPMRCNEYCFAPIVPVPGTKILKVNYVGISFALRSNLVKTGDFRFVPGRCEDFTLFSKVVEAGFHARFAPDVTYIVKGGLADIQTRESVDSKSLRLEKDKIEKKDTPEDPCIIQSTSNLLGSSVTTVRSLPIKEKELPTFVFPDKDDHATKLYFGQNILGLVSTLYDSAISKGCMDNWSHGNLEISICLRHDRCNKNRNSDFLIQYQMEQIASKGVKGHNAKLTKQYASKLKNALQVWDFSKLNVRLLSDFEMRVTRKDAAYYVPMEALLNTDHFNIDLCKRHLTNLHSSLLFPQNFDDTPKTRFLSDQSRP